MRVRFTEFRNDNVRKTPQRSCTKLLCPRVFICSSNTSLFGTHRALPRSIRSRVSRTKPLKRCSFVYADGARIFVLLTVFSAFAFRRPVRVLLLRHQQQFAGTAGGRGREDRAEDEDETAEPTAAAAAATGSQDGRCREDGRRRRREKADQPGAHRARQQRQRPPVRVTVGLPKMGRRLDRLTKNV